MVNLLLVVFAFAVIVAYELPSMLDKKQWRELITFSILVLLGLIISCLMTMGVKLPNPVEGIELVTSKVYGFFESMFHSLF